MYALITNNEITEIGELQTLFPNEIMPNAIFAQAHGAKEIVEGHQEDRRFYFVSFDKYEVGTDVVTRKYANSPKALEDKAEVDKDNNPIYVKVWDATADNGKGSMVDSAEQVITKGLKSVYIDEFKRTANSMLAQTDWMVIRKIERNIDIPQDVATKRAAILAECTRLIAAATAASDMTAFIAVVSSAKWA
jgi:hypothetical protein